MPTVLYALSDPIRLQIVSQLAEEDMLTTGQCLADSDLPKSTQSHHFKVLRESGITRSRPEGTRLLICLRREELDELFPGLLDATLCAYRRSLGAATAPARLPGDISHP